MLTGAGLPKRLVFSGGGTRCLVFLSALELLEERGYLRDVKEWWGTSAGALVAALLAISQSNTRRTSDVLFTAHFHKFRDVNIANLVQISDTWGLDDGHALIAEIENLFEALMPGTRHITLAEVPGFHSVVADLNEYKTVVCSAATFPTLKLSEAVRASMSLPVFYRPFHSPVNGHIFIDGGLKAAFPWACLPSDEAREEALGFAFRRPWASGPPRTFTEYLLCMLHFDDPKRIPIQEKTWPRNILWFASPPFPAWYVRIQEDDIALLKKYGKEAVDEWEKKCLDSKPLPSSQGKSGTQQLCEDHCTRSPTSPGHHTGELLDTLRSSGQPSRPQAPSRDPQPYRQHLHRRWSL